mgnify:FL=1
MTAEQAEVVGQYVAVERIAQLRAKRTTANTASQAAEDGARHRAERDTGRAGESTNKRTGPTTGQCCAYAARSTTDSADGRANFHGLMERCNFGGVTAGTLQ